MVEDQNKHQLLKCPDASCDAKPTEDEIKSFLNENTYEKYKQFKLNKEMA